MPGPINISIHSARSNTNHSDNILEDLEIDALERKNRLNSVRKFTHTERFLLGSGISSFALAASLGFHIPHLASSLTVGLVALMILLGILLLRKVGVREFFARAHSTVDRKKSNNLRQWLHNRNLFAQEVVTQRGSELTHHSLDSLTKARRELDFTLESVKNQSSTTSALFALVGLFLISGSTLISQSLHSVHATRWLNLFQEADLSPVAALLVGLAFIRVAFDFQAERLIQHKHAIIHAIELVTFDR